MEAHRTEAGNFRILVINRAVLEEGCAAIFFQEISLSYFICAKTRRIEPQIKLPPREVSDIFGVEIEGEGFANSNARVTDREGEPDTGGYYGIFRVLFKPKEAIPTPASKVNRN